jgi:integrase
MEVLGANPLRCTLARTYTAHVYRVLHETLGCRSADDVLALHRDRLVRGVTEANPAHPHQRRLCRIALNHFLGGVVFRDHATAAQCLHLRGRDLPGKAGTVTAKHPADYAVTGQSYPARDHFTSAEIQALLALPHLGLRDRLVLRILSETGLRRRAVSWLLVDGVFDRVAGAPLSVCRALEKGLVVRQFVLGPETQRLLSQYVRDGHPGPDVRWLFPSPRSGGHRAPLTPGVVNAILLRACHQAGIRGRHTHSHAVRKFVVCRLMAANNRIEPDDRNCAPVVRAVSAVWYRGRRKVARAPHGGRHLRHVLGRQPVRGVSWDEHPLAHPTVARRHHIQAASPAPPGFCAGRRAPRPPRPAVSAVWVKVFGGSQLLLKLGNRQRKALPVVLSRDQGPPGPCSNSVFHRSRT